MGSFLQCPHFINEYIKGKRHNQFAWSLSVSEWKKTLNLYLAFPFPVFYLVLLLWFWWFAGSASQVCHQILMLLWMYAGNKWGYLWSSQQVIVYFSASSITIMLWPRYYICLITYLHSYYVPGTRPDAESPVS